MTCIVGFVKNKTVFMGGDSAGVSGLSTVQRKDTKVFKVGKFLMGYTSSFRMGQILRYSFTPPKIPKGMGLYEYMCTEFIDELRKTFKEKGYCRINNNEEEGGTFLVGIKGRLFSIEDDFQVGECIDNFDACGCGNREALAVMNTLKDSDILTPEEILIKALETAEKYSGGVKGPFNLIKE